MAKFYFFEKVVQLFYDRVFTQPKETYSKTTQLGITFASGAESKLRLRLAGRVAGDAGMCFALCTVRRSGYLAGVICAVVSHPADSLVSLMGKAENKGKR